MIIFNKMLTLLLYFAWSVTDGHTKLTQRILHHPENQSSSQLHTLYLSLFFLERTILLYSNSFFCKDAVQVWRSC